MDGAAMTAEEVTQVSRWPSRGEQLSLLVGQILSPGASLSSQLLGPGGMLASQVKQKGEGEEGEHTSTAAPSTPQGGLAPLARPLGTFPRAATQSGAGQQA